MRTMKKIETAVIEPIDELTKPNAGFTEYQNARIALCEKTALKDEKGNFIIKEGAYTFKDNVQPKLEPLQKKHKADIDNRKKQMEDEKKILKEEYDGELHRVSFEHVPESMTLDDLASLEFMITEDVAK